MITILHALSLIFRSDDKEDIQKKTFTRWINSHLSKAGRETIEDLYTDLRDGIPLISLLEVLAGPDLKPERGKDGDNEHINDLDRALQMMKDNYDIELGNINSRDIQDGNPKLTLGLVWSIVLHWQIKGVMVNEVEDLEEINIEKTLISWCQVFTQGYKDVDVTDLTTSWRDGLAFNALIHYFRPDLFNYKYLVGKDNQHNLNHAFDVANEKLGVVKLLDAKDMDVDLPDKKSVIIYVMCLFQTLQHSNLASPNINNNEVSETVFSQSSAINLVEFDIGQNISDQARDFSETACWIGTLSFEKPGRKRS